MLRVIVVVAGRARGDHAALAESPAALTLNRKAALPRFLSPVDRA